jgi:hypothetical protein
MTTLFNYVPSEVSVLLAGIMPVEGFIDGTFVTVDKDVMPYRSRVTADGAISRIYFNSQSYTVTLTVHIGSSANTFLTKMWQLDEIAQRGKFPLLIKDGSGSDLFFSLTSWIEVLPSMVKSNSTDTRTWRIKCSSAVINFGSNNGESGLIEDLLNIATSALPAMEGLI